MFNFKKFFNRKDLHSTLNYQNEPNVNFSKLPKSITQNLIENLIRSIINFDNDHDRYTHFKQVIERLSFLNKKSLNDLYNLESDKLDINASIIFLPWLHAKPLTLIKDSYFRIFCDTEYLKRYFIKVKNLTLSIQNHGFVEKMQSDKPIIGYFLQKKNEKKIYIMAGNHRFNITRYFYPEFNLEIISPNINNLKKRELIGTTVNKLGYYSNIFYYEEINNWPSVSSGLLSKMDAEKIFNSYFD